MKRDRYNINLYKGESFAMVSQFKDNAGVPFDLTNATITAQCRDIQTNSVLFSFVCTKSATPTDGKITLSLSASNSASLTAQKNALYDVKIAWTDGTVKKYLGGSVTIIDTVTS